MNIKWPGGKSSSDFRAQVRRFAKQIVGGEIVAIDPGTHFCGWCKFEQGVMVDSGTINMKPNAPIQGRLPQLYDGLSPLSGTITMVAIEKIVAPTVHYYLRWSIGVAIASLRSYYLIEVPIPVWKAVAAATPDYKKTDEWDAKMIGLSVLLTAREVLADDTASSAD